MNSKQIRQQFIDFFLSKGHSFVPSSPVVPLDDPTLMFTNAGMNQFKPIFLATERAQHPRVANTQKCIRAGGKHNDLDDVGQDTYHHTFFEMLGNWSFGNYFKKEAIEWAWELLTGVWGIDKTRLHATYFQGDTAEGLEPDSEAARLWRSVTDIDPAHIHPGNKKDNFWEMGDTGPCGPCSEIHIDLTPDKSGGPLVNKGDARVIELWNLVFIQFNRGADGKLTPLPAKHVDTGMGFERLCAVLQGMNAGRVGKVSNYDTDVFTPIFEAIERRTGAPRYQATLPTDKSTIDNRQSTILLDVSFRVIADHVRCLTFALTDGAIPSNEGRGYVLRRILRRAVRYGRQYMNMHEPFLCDLVSTVVEHMGDVFPELRTAHAGKNVKHVQDLIRDEEASFIKTLDRGMKLFEDAADHARRQHHGKIRGEDAFKLHDTYGFPIDLTELMAEEQGLTIDVGEYERLMEEARGSARKKSATPQAFAAATGAALLGSIGRMPVETADVLKYETTQCDAKVLGWVTAADGTGVLLQDVVTALVLDQTCFYAEQGGQVSDTGTIEADTGVFQVASVLRAEKAVAHVGALRSGRIERGQRVVCRVDPHRRDTVANHTSTHLLNWALREVLCEPHARENPHVQQKGSLVDPEKTRFDFSHPKHLSEEELSRIEGLVNEQIAKAHPVYDMVDGKREVDQKLARQINTLRAVFGEKYPDKVRVVSIGADIKPMLADPRNPKWMQYSVEFCGGTHLKNSKEAEQFVLVSEEAVAKGIRRVVGVTAERAREAIRLGEFYLEVADALRHGRTPPDAPPGTKASACGPGQPTPSPQPSPWEGEGKQPPPLTKGGIEGGVGRSGPYDLTRLLRELSDAVIPVRTRHQLADHIAGLQEAAKEHEKKSAAAAQRGAVEAVADLLAAKALDIGGVTVLVGEVPGANADALRTGIDYVRNKEGSSAVLLATVDNGKVILVAGMTKDVIDRGLKAGDLIKEISPLVGGKGGGRPDMAQGGGNDPALLGRALDAAAHWIAGRLA